MPGDRVSDPSRRRPCRGRRPGHADHGLAGAANAPRPRPLRAVAAPDPDQRVLRRGPASPSLVRRDPRTPVRDPAGRGRDPQRQRPRPARPGLPEAHDRAARGAGLPPLPRPAGQRGGGPPRHPRRDGEVPAPPRHRRASRQPRRRRPAPAGRTGAMGMTATRDPNRLIRAFLDEGPIDLPDRAYDEVHLQIGHSRQRVVIGPWREPRMSPILRFAIAAAAVIAAIAIGINLVPRQSAVGPATTTLPSPAPTPSPTASPAYSWPGPLRAGTYTTDFAYDLPVALRFTVGDGWGALDLNVWKNDHVSMMALVTTNLY